MYFFLKNRLKSLVSRYRYNVSYSVCKPIKQVPMNSHWEDSYALSHNLHHIICPWQARLLLWLSHPESRIEHIYVHLHVNVVFLCSSIIKSHSVMWIHRIRNELYLQTCRFTVLRGCFQGDFFAVNVINHERIITCLCDVILNNLC